MNFKSISFSVAHPNFHDITEYDENLYVSSCGAINQKEFSATTSRKNGRNDYHILYVRDGHISLSINQVPHELYKGDFAFIDYGIPHEYTCDKNQPIFYYWVHFKGNCANSLLTDLGFEDSFVLNAEYDSKISDKFEQIISILNTQRVMYFKKCSILLTSILLEFYTKGVESVFIKQRNFTLIDNVITIMRTGNCVGKNIDDFAAMCHLSKSRFIKKFKKYTGTTPIDYRNSILIDKAKWHLKNTNLTVSEISDMLGFLNPSYFSTLFKKHINMSPREYRNKFHL